MPQPVIDYASSTAYLKAIPKEMKVIDSPFVTGVGFEISDQLTDEQLASALTIVMDSFINLFTILEDGYTNYGPASPSPYGAITLAPGLGEEEHSDRWIPITLA